jgi:hypothetical protein
MSVSMHRRAFARLSGSSPSYERRLATDPDRAVRELWATI